MNMKTLMLVASAIAAGVAFGDGAQMPRALFDAKAPGAERQLLVGGGAKGQVTWKIGATGQVEAGCEGSTQGD